MVVPEPEAVLEQRRFHDVDVVLVDGHESVRRGVELLLENAGLHVVGSSGSSTRGFALIEARRPDVVVLDLHLERRQAGLDLLARAREDLHGIGLLVFTAAEEPALIEAAMQLADGLVRKSSPAVDLIDAVRSVAVGRRYTDAGLDELIADADLGLSRRELEILALLAEGQTGYAIALRLMLSPETVRTHIRNAMVKLGAPTRTRAVVLAMRLGLLETTTSSQAEERERRDSNPRPPA